MKNKQKLSRETIFADIYNRLDSIRVGSLEDHTKYKIKKWRDSKYIRNRAKDEWEEFQNGKSWDKAIDEAVGIIEDYENKLTGMYEK